MDEAIKELLRNVVEEMVPAHKFLGITLHEIEAGRAVLHMAYKPELIGDPRHNRLHGGIVAAVMDSAGGIAGVTTLTGPEDMISSIDIRVDFLEPGKPQDVLVEGKIMRSGNNILVVNMKAWHPDNPRELICEGRGVYRVRRMNAQQPKTAQEVNLPE